MRRRGNSVIPTVLALSAFLMLAGLGGCTPWPDYATGGLAERHATDSAAIVLLENRYETLVTAGGLRLAAGRMTDASLLLVRARREHAAGLLEDAERSTWQVESMLASIERDIRPSRPAARSRPGS